jgi:chromosome segregation ATPase
MSDFKVWRKEMKEKMAQLQKIIIPIVAIVIGLSIGLGVGQYQLKKEQKLSQDRMKEANKKIAFIQKKMTDEKDEATTSLGQQCQSDLDKMQNEKKALGAQLTKLKEQKKDLDAKIEAKVKEAEELTARNKKELQEAGKKYDQVSQHNKDLERDLKKVKGEKDALQAQLKKTTQKLSSCEANNANLCIIGEELVKAYKNKGVKDAILEKEPLTQIKKVELEQLAQKYKENIEQLKIKK